MKLHRNAALSWSGRRELVRRVEASVVHGSGLCARLEGELGLHDRSSAPRRVANRTAPERVEAIVKLRRPTPDLVRIPETVESAIPTSRRSPRP
jgi:hypothetical protein